MSKSILPIYDVVQDVILDDIVDTIFPTGNAILSTSPSIMLDALVASSTTSTQWTDLSGNDNHATNASSPPTLTTFESKPCYDFNGTSQHFTLGSNYLFSSTGITVIAVVAADIANDSNSRFLFDFGQVAGQGYGVYNMFSDKVSMYALGNQVDAALTADTGWRIVATRIEIGYDQKVWIDGDMVISTTTTTSDLDATTINEAPTRQGSFGPFTIGAQSKTGSQANRFLDGKIGFFAAWDRPLSVSEFDAVHATLRSKWGTNSPTITFPTFAKQGAKLPSPSWLTATGNELFFCRIVDNDSLRANLPDLPATKYSMLYSSDHAAGTGYWGRADFDHPDDVWTDTGAAVYSEVNQMETPDPMYDPIGNRMLLFPHRTIGNSYTYSSQHMEVYESTDLDNFTKINDDPMLYGQHTGYGHYYRENGEVKGYHLMFGDECPTPSFSVSPDGEQDFRFVTTANYFTSQHIIDSADGELFQSMPYFYDYIDGNRYLITVVSDRPRSDVDSKNAIVMFPIAKDTHRAIDGYYKLVEKSVTTTDPDYRLSSDPIIFKHDFDYYIVYTGSDSSGNQSLCMAKSTVTPASAKTPVLIQIESNGDIKRPSGTVTTLADWDAANDAIPSTVTAGVTSGAHASSQVIGEYYQFQCGTGTQDIQLISTDTFDPTQHDMVEFIIEDYSCENDGVSHQIGMVDSFTTFDGFLFTDNTFGTNWRLRGWSGGVVQLDVDSYVFPYSNGSANIRGASRDTPVDLRLFLLDGAKTLVVTVDGQVCLLRDISADGITFNNAFSAMRITSSSASTWMRFSRYAVLTYDNYHAAGSFSSASGVHTITLPASAEVGDLAIVFYSSASTFSLTAPSGTGFSSVSGNNNHTIAIAYKNLTANDIANGTLNGGSSSIDVYGEVHTYRGVYVADTASSGGGASPSVDLTGPNGLVLRYSIGNVTGSGGWATTPTGVQRMDDGGALSYEFRTIEQKQVASGASGTEVFDHADDTEAHIVMGLDRT